MILRVEGVHAYYGQSHILRGVSISVSEGEVVCLLGRNGMGKTTLLRTIMGLTTVTRGTMWLAEENITALPPHRIASLGVGFIPEDRGIFPDLTVAENLKMGSMGRHSVNNQGLLFPVLTERARQRAGSLSGGEQQMLAIARALLAQPKLLLIDEFSQGLQPSVVKRIGEAITKICSTGVGVLLVEQNVKLALRLAVRGYIMEKGQIVHWGTSTELSSNEEALRNYLVV